MSILYDFDPAMADPAQAVPSPCVGICRMDEKNAWCAGCFRTIPELTGWSNASNERKIQIWHQVKERMF